MVTPINGTKKVSFWTEKKVTCDPQFLRKMPIFVLKPK